MKIETRYDKNDKVFVIKYLGTNDIEFKKSTVTDFRLRVDSYGIPLITYVLDNENDKQYIEGSLFDSIEDLKDALKKQVDKISEGKTNLSFFTEFYNEYS